MILTALARINEILKLKFNVDHNIIINIVGKAKTVIITLGLRILWNIKN